MRRRTRLNIWEKAISILVGNLNLGRSYLITTVKTCLCLPALKNRVAFYGYPICLMDTRMATACTFLTNGGSLLNSHGLIINKKTPSSFTRLQFNYSFWTHVHGVRIIDITIENKCMTVWNFYYSENHELSMPFEIFLNLNISSWKKNLRN